jgi:hypothetical protein
MQGFMGKIAGAAAGNVFIARVSEASFSSQYSNVYAFIW